MNTSQDLRTYVRTLESLRNSKFAGDFRRHQATVELGYRCGDCRKYFSADCSMAISHAIPCYRFER